DFVFEELVFFAGPETGEGENRFANAGFAYSFSFRGAGDAEPIGASPFKCLGDLRAAVAVAVAFDDTENFSRRCALFVWRIHEVADGVKIVREGGERDFGPDGAAVLTFGHCGFLCGHAVFPTTIANLYFTAFARTCPNCGERAARMTTGQDAGREPNSIHGVY